jgi:ABC-type amino acid transport substrate-binding protein
MSSDGGKALQGDATIFTNRLYAMGRCLLPAIGVFAVTLALQTHAHAQTKAGAGDGAGSKTTIRILAVGAPPLADEQLPEGGLVLALVNASLGPEAGSAVRWSTAAVAPQMLADTSVDLVLPVEGADCERPKNLTPTTAALCDAGVFSEPILQVVLGLFTLSNSAFKFDSDDSILGKTVCLSRDHDLSALNDKGRNWAAYKRITLLRRGTLLDCLAAVQAGEADTFVATDLEGTHLLQRTGLAPFFTMQARPLATGTVHAVARRDYARGADMLEAINRGLKRLKQGDAYASIVQKHLIAAASAQTAVPGRREAPPAAAAGVGAAAATAKAAAVPVLDAESRQRALKYLKRGTEELADGRIAPARLLFERAAEMGLAQAAMALAATFDPAELKQPHLVNVLPDAGEAKRWYERAGAMGADAAGRLQRLGAK